MGRLASRVRRARQLVAAPARDRAAPHSRDARLGRARADPRRQHVRGPGPRPDRRARRPSPRRRRAGPARRDRPAQLRRGARARAARTSKSVTATRRDRRVRGRGAGRARARMRRVRQHLRRATSGDTIETLPSLCAPGATVIWTRHRRAPDRTTDVRAVVRRRGLQRSRVRGPRRDSSSASA